MRCDFAESGGGGVFAESEILEGVEKSDAAFVESAFDAGVEGFEDASVGEGADVAGEGEAESESLEAVGVDQTDVKLEHVGQEVFRYVVVEEQFDFFFRVVAVLHLEYFK